MYGWGVRIVFISILHDTSMERMRFFHQIALILDQKHLLARFWQSASLFWRTRKGWVTFLLIYLIVVVLLQLLLQVLLNLWNRNFFDSLARKDGHALWMLAQFSYRWPRPASFSPPRRCGAA